MIYSLLKPLLLRMDAELSHQLIIQLLKYTQNSVLKFFWKQNLPEKPVELMGLTFPNRVGLAAGLDKNGECIDAFSDMGFGFIEIGTVTPKAQRGNPKPRLFRLPEAQALINRMGFNNYGVQRLLNNLHHSRFRGNIGINIGKNKSTPNSHSQFDYLLCLQQVYAYASYITINISSPNTPGLRDLQFGEQLQQLLTTLKNEQNKLTAENDRYVPLVVKIAPDLDSVAIEQIANILLTTGMDGVIATNTTLSRTGVSGLLYADEQGGLSGDPVHEMSINVVKTLRQHVGRDFPIIGVGGIDSADKAEQMLAAGADLIQIYTGLIYQGPALIKTVVTRINETT